MNLNLNSILLIILYMSTLRTTNLTDLCVPYNTLFTTLPNYKLQRGFSFDFTPFIDMDFPSRDDLYDGNYEYYSVDNDQTHMFKIKLQELFGDKKKFNVALKVFRTTSINPQTIREIEVLKQMSETHPLSVTRFLACGYEPSFKTVFILLEDFNNTVESEASMQNYYRFNKIKPFELAINTLLMTRALLDLHLEGYAYNHVDSKNFVFLKNETHRIIKLLDFNFLSKDTEYFRIFYSQYTDPVFWGKGQSSRWRDVYSLGITLYGLNSPLSDIFINDSIIQYPEDKDDEFKSRYEVITHNLDVTVQQIASKYDEANQEALSAIVQIIKGFTQNSIEERMSLDSAISILEKVIEKFDPDSPYLERNLNELYSSFYNNVRSDMRSYGQDLPSTALIAKQRSNTFSLSVLCCCATPDNKTKAKGIVLNPISQLPAETWTVKRENLGEIYKNYNNPLKTIIEPPAKSSFFGFRII